MTRSASRMAAAGDSAKRAPFLANGLHFSALRFQTVSLYPALRRFDAMPPPMVPRPRKEIVVIITTDLFAYFFAAAGAGELTRTTAPVTKESEGLTIALSDSEMPLRISD